MNDRLVLVSADAHTSAPPEFFRPYLEARYLPYLDDLVEENERFRTFLTAMSSFSDETLELIDTDGAIRSGGTDGAWDVGRRLREMDREGVAAEILINGTQFATVPFFGTQNRVYPAEVQAAGTRAYHRWLADCMAQAEGRLFAIAYPGPCLDMAETLAELDWLAGRGFRSITVPGFVPDPALPPLSDPYYEPFWAACAERGFVLSVHAGHGRPQGETFAFLAQLQQRTAGKGRDEALRHLNEDEHSPIALDMRPRQVLWQLMLAGVFDRHPQLRFAMTEVRADWLPATLVHLDTRFEQGGTSLRKRPSEYWAEHCFAALSFIHRAEVAMRYDIGVEQMMFGRDYPHPESTWPNTLDWIRDAFVGVDDAEVRLILGGNAIRCYGLDEAEMATIAERVGPVAGDILGTDQKVAPELVEHFHTRGGYLRPAEQIDTTVIDQLFDSDLAAII